MGYTASYTGDDAINSVNDGIDIILDDEGLSFLLMVVAVILIGGFILSRLLGKR